MIQPSVENLRKASMAIYIAVDKHVADDVSSLLKWAADEIEVLQRWRTAETRRRASRRRKAKQRAALVGGARGD